MLDYQEGIHFVELARYLSHTRFCLCLVSWTRVHRFVSNWRATTLWNTYEDTL